MINELQLILPKIPNMLFSTKWDSVLIDKYPPTIHRLFAQISDNRWLLLHKLFNTNNQHALMHSHSWNFACKVLSGEYEMGIGFSKDRNVTPKSIYKSYIKSGDIYEMLSPDIWHYTKPTNNIDCTYSILLIGPRHRERLAKNNSPLTDGQKKDILNWFNDNKNKIAGK